MVDRETIRRRLEENDETFQKLVIRHRRIDSETSQLDGKPFLIPAEEERLQRLKREKLRLRDCIESKVQAAMSGMETEC